MGNILCPEHGCGTQLNDWDIRNMGLSKADRDRYEQLSLKNAIAEMDDVGWCPVLGCSSIANIDRDDNTGRCQHCEFHFCLDCRDHVHPFKRCKINRLDLMDKFKSAADEVKAENAKYESMLTDLYFKKCTKLCPNPRCQVRICKVESGCTHVQCTICFHYMCWACGKPAKGQKHFKENPECIDEKRSLLPAEVTTEMIQQFLGLQ